MDLFSSVGFSQVFQGEQFVGLQLELTKFAKINPTDTQLFQSHV